MSTKRNYLPPGTKIQFSQGCIYEITGVPIGNGGGSVIYPADRIFQTKDGFSRDGIVYALKECYPLSEKHHFIRNPQGQIVPEIPDDGELVYLEKVQQMQLCEQQITQQIYRTASRLLPIRESGRQILLTLPGKEPVTVENTVTVMESLTAKGSSLSSYIKEYRQLPPSQTFHIIQQVLFALREVHNEGYLHLDIQDGNIFIKGTLEDESDIATMIDFGSARPLHEGQTDVISDRVIFTTQGFSAPEILLHNDS